MFKGINHVALVTGDMDETVRFWRDLLGLRLVGGLGDKKYKHYFFEVSKNALVSFFEWPGAESIEEKDAGWALPGPIAFDHLCLEVETEDELWHLKERLDGAGFWVTEVLDGGFIRSFFTFDPNGISLEIGVAEADLRDAPRMVDPDLSKAVSEGPDPRPDHWPEPGPDSTDPERKVYPSSLARILEGRSSWS